MPASPILRDDAPLEDLVDLTFLAFQPSLPGRVLRNETRQLQSFVSFPLRGRLLNRGDVGKSASGLTRSRIG